MEKEQNNEIRSWKDIQVDMSSPIGMMIDLINILNQRLAAVEDQVMITDENGEKISFTELYHRQALAQLEAQKESAQESEVVETAE